ncbi:putative DNA repair protein [Podospora aff. communis PSN243]|uniref:DNA repair protein n=1 Tax=Podospora aff. communis PSN243 TaxID=3040156 RepID=A0AAV9GX16_9PEZI|nr:putative DNA repair protein [Podospora aff. communis PSN243]
MVRTRRSQAAAGEEATPPVSGTRGRAKRDTLIASRDSSAAPTPASASTSEGSEYQTPLTSHGATPTPATEPVSSSRKRTGRIEVQLPATRSAAATSQSTLRQSIYSMNSKRKRDIVEDSEADDSDPPDAKLARKLQEEEDIAASRASATIAPGTRRHRFPIGTRRAAHPPPLASDDELANTDDGEVSDDIDDSDVSDASSVPRARRTPKRPGLTKAKPGAARAPLKTQIPDSELSSLASEPEDVDYNSTDEDAALISSDEESADDSRDDESFTPAVGQPAEGANARTSTGVAAASSNRRAYRAYRSNRRVRRDRKRLEDHHPELKTMWTDLEKMPVLKAGKAEQPKSISRQLKPFQLEGLAWMTAMEKTEWKGGLLGDEMGLGKTIQAVSLIMSDWPAPKPTLVLVPPVALMQWMTEIESYTDGTLKTLVLHGTNSKAKNLTVKDIKKYHVIIMSYNSLESMYRRQEKGWKRKGVEGAYKEESVIHKTHFHRAILDEAHSIKTRTTMTAKACFALKVEYRWCLSGTPLQNRIGEFFSLVRFLNIKPFASYLCKACPCTTLEWSMDSDSRCTQCGHGGMQHVSVFNQELLNPIQKHGNFGPGKIAFQNLRLMTDRIMLRRLKKDHTNAMELPVKEINVERQFFGEEENDFANSIMTNGQRKFDTYVASGVLLNNYANIFGLIMQMRQVADHPDLILKKNSEGGQNVLVCTICDEPAEDAIRSRCKHDFCRACAKSYLHSSSEPNCPRCHIPLSIDLEQPEIEQDEVMVKKSSIINRIKMENWTSSSKIELLVHELHKLRSNHASHKSIIFSQFTTMLQLIEWRLRRAGITTVMLDGSMTPAQRQASIEHFMKNPDVECFLVSLKAGGVALNLTEASHVFIVDPWWNPAAEWQSADRCHRIGQTRPCTITRLCIEDSVESRMVLLQEKKTNMINSTINADDAAMDSLSPEDLQFLFNG